MKKITFSEYQEILRQDFKKINDEFNKENIVWWAHSGTLLGILREKDLIGWDDDIDMAMSIVDFNNNKEKINEICEKYGYKLVDRLENKGLDICRIINKEKFIIDFKGKEYISSPYIDLMMSIPVKRMNKVKAWFWSTTNQFLFIYNSFSSPLPKYGWIKGEVKKLPSIYNFSLMIFKIIIFPMFLAPYIQNIYLKKKAEKKYENLCMYYNYNNKQLIYKKDNLKQVDFLNTKVWINKNEIEEIELWFGKNWNSKPSEDKQIPHHLFLTPNDGKNEYDIIPMIIK